MMRLFAVFLAATLLTGCIASSAQPSPGSDITPTVNFDQFIGEPPAARLEIDGGTQSSGVGSYCWPTKKRGSEVTHVCADMIGLPTSWNPLVAEQPMQGSLHLPIPVPPQDLSMAAIPVTPENEIQLDPPGEYRFWTPSGAQQEITLSNEVDQQFEADLGPGLYVLSVSANWTELGSVIYGFLVQIPGAEGQTGTPDGQVAQGDQPRQEPQPEAEALLPAAVQNSNTFGFDLYQQIATGSQDNLIFSPYSIWQAFSMVYAGARGETETQMAEVLRFSPNENQHPALNALDYHLSSVGENTNIDGDPFQLNIANSLWGQEGYDFHDEFLNTMSQYYGAGLRVLDFALDSQLARQTINNWIAQQTEDKIKDMIPPEGVITPDTRLVLANAIYFNAAWVWPFDEGATEAREFTILDGSTVVIPMMHQDTARIPYIESENYQAALLPYNGSAQMVVILPEEGHFTEIEGQLDVGFIERLRLEASNRDVALSMPKFDFETELDLVQLLKAMGLTTAFDGQADFSGISAGGLYISAALHKGTITVDEQGTEAAAATVIAMEESALERAEMHLNRPFIYAIIEQDSGAVLFLGRVMNPVLEN